MRDAIALDQGICGKCAAGSRCSAKFCSCKCHTNAVSALTSAANEIGVTLQFWTSRDETTSAASGSSTCACSGFLLRRFTGSLGWTSLRGPAKYKLLQSLDLAKVLPATVATRTRTAWTQFLAVYDAANQRRVLKEDEISHIEVQY